MTELWAPWYADVEERQPYLIDGDDITYRLGAEWLEELAVEDWGCGLGWMRNHVPAYLYTGIDGTASPFADVVADLVTYRHRSEAIFMRHVLEHNLEWKTILENAIASFQKRFFLVLYTPLVEKTRVHLVEPTLDVPELQFSLDDLAACLPPAGWTVETVSSETVFRIEK